MWAYICWEVQWLIQGYTESVHCQGIAESRDGPSLVGKALPVTRVGSTETWTGGCYCSILENEQTVVRRGDLNLEDCEGKGLIQWLSGSLGGRKACKALSQPDQDQGAVPGFPFSVPGSWLSLLHISPDYNPLEMGMAPEIPNC